MLLSTSYTSLIYGATPVEEYVDPSDVFFEEIDENDEFYGYRAIPEENIPIGRISYEGDEVRQLFGNSIPSAYPYSSNINITRLPEYLPDVRNQNPTGSCWAHTSLAMGEINLAKKGTISNNSADYSEVDLSYFSYHFVEDPLGGTEGDSNSAIYSSSLPNCYVIGGNLRFSEHTLAGWIGASDEIKHGTSIASLPSDIKYLSEDNPNGNITNDMAYDDAAHLIGSYHADITNASLKNGTISEADMSAMLDEVKTLIMQNGSVGVSYLSTDSYYNGVRSSYYYPKSTSSTNHAVTVIGWDDSYSCTYFNNEPAGDGAWLVRNSWGPSWRYGKNGYFWLSYYDKSLYTEAISFEYDSVTNYDRNYQYDGCMNSSVMAQMPKGSKVANVFTAAECNDGYIEKLRAVSYYSSIPTQKIKVDIYKNLTDKSDPLSGICVSTKEETLYYAGFHTITLNEEVLLRGGTDFSVVITLLNEQYIDAGTGNAVNNNKFVCEKNANASWYKCVAGKSANTSFYKMTDYSAWTTPWANNNALGNIRIKAFSKIEENLPDDPEIYSIDYVLDDGVNSELNPHEYTEGTESLILKKPEKYGCIFDGWYYDEAFNNKLDENNDGDYILSLSDEDIVVYAKWIQCAYEIIYAGENSAIDPKIVMVMKDQDVIILDEVYPKKGYTFTCWNTSKDGSGVSYQANSNAGKNLCDLEKGETSLTLYPIYTKNKYTITYHPNGGLGEDFCETLTYDEAGFISMNKFQCMFKSFSYYCTSESGEGVIFTEGQRVENLCTGDENDENIDLYAIWAANGSNYFFEGLLEEYTYTGNAIMPKFDVWMKGDDGNGIKLIYGVDYTVKINNNRLPLSVATINIIGKNNYAGILDGIKTFRISEDPAKNAATGHISLSRNFKISVRNSSNVCWNGAAVEPDIIFTPKSGSEGIALPIIHKDYEVVYSNNCDAGKATAYVYAIGERYCDSKRINFNIKKLNIAANSSRFKVNISGNAVLNNKKGAVPDIEVIYSFGDSSYTLTNGKDYTVKFLNNKRVTNDGTFIITGKGNFSGKIDSRNGYFYGDRTFSVVKASIDNNEDFIICLSDISRGNIVMSTKTEVYDIYGNKLKTKLVYDETQVIGKNVDVAVKISCNGIVLNPQSKYDKGIAAVDADAIYAELIGVNNYTGKVIKKINVSKLSASTSKISKVRFIGQLKHYYNGKQQTLYAGEIGVSSKDGSNISREYYDVLYARNIDRGTATAFVVGKNGATGFKKIKYKIYSFMWN